MLGGQTLGVGANVRGRGQTLGGWEKLGGANVRRGGGQTLRGELNRCKRGGGVVQMRCGMGLVETVFQVGGGGGAKAQKNNRWGGELS